MGFFQNILNNGGLSFKLATKVLPQKGNLVYEYNPFRNYRLTEKKFEYDGSYYTLEELETNYNITPDDKSNSWKGVPNDKEPPQVREAGELVDFITNELDFDPSHPVNILPQYSYDNSVNLILNDGKNNPRLINSRFSAVGRNRYEIVDRKGDYDSNIYNQGNSFDIDTSLYKQVSNIPKLKFLGTVLGGNLSIGNYHFYFRYVDADENESDFVMESGLVSVFIGHGTQTVRSGFRNENSHKMARFVLSNIDASYQHVQVYYTKATSDIYQNPTISAFKIEQKFNVNQSHVCDICITGFEEVTEVPLTDINPFYQICDNVNAQASCQNMLFLANVNKPDLNYPDLEDLSLYFLPYLSTTEYQCNLDKNYKADNPSQGYTDPVFIYNYTGYWDQEIYRLGIVYILSNNTLSPVFNIRGAEDITTYDPEHPQYSTQTFSGQNRQKISCTEDGFIISDTKKKKLENNKGVISLKDQSGTESILGIDIRVDKRVIEYLKSEYKIKGFFFVRQKRIPITLCQALTIGIDQESKTPVLPIATNGQLITNLDLKTESTYICRNKKTGELVKGDTLVEKPKSFWQKFTSFGVGLLTGVTTGVISGIMAGVVTNMLFSGKYDYAYRVYRNNKDWEVYTLQSKPDGKTCYIAERFLTDSKQLENTFDKRLYFLKSTYVQPTAAICPEYDINYPYYNSIFNGSSITVQESTTTPEKDYLEYDVYDERHFYNSEFKKSTSEKAIYTCKVLGVEDNVKLVAIDDNMFSARAGEAEEAFRYKYIGLKEKLTSSYNLIRGSFGPYLAITGFPKVNTTIDLKIPGYNPNNLEDYFKIRFNDKSSFYAISDRIDINDLDYWFKESAGELQLRNSLFRGDCYICQFTHRLNRNFQDPSAPTNDDIVDSKCWAQNYEISDGVLKTENFEKINLGDVNAIQLGMWVTSRFRSSRNLNIRNINESVVDETALTGHPRGYYPYYPISVEGSYKTPEALCYNSGFEKSVSERYNFEVPDVPAMKNNFSTRILYSDIQVTDAFKNGFRQFKGQHYRDYPITYGSITKLIELKNNLLCIFEHGVALIPVNERAVAGEGAGGLVYINTSNVLPETPKILSDIYGSQWADSVIKTPKGVYGVDTVAKKIWFTDGAALVCISDLQVGEFLNNHISLQERELTPIIGIRNVKTHYNAFKQDVMFTFYDNTYGFEEKVWNLCFNEFINKFVTFYSWVPSFSENIYNTYFSFDRNTSKWIAKLGASNENNTFTSGIYLSNNIIEPPTNDDSEEIEIGTLKVAEDILPKGVSYTYTFTLEHDNYKNYKYFRIGRKENGDNVLILKHKGDYEKLCAEQYVRVKNIDGKDQAILPSSEHYELGLPLKYDENKRRIWLNQEEQDKRGPIVTLLNIRAKVNISIPDNHQNIKEMEEYKDSYNDNYSTYNSGYFEYVVAVIPQYNLQFLTTDFWKHGESGIIDLKDSIKVTHWYGKQHPFEFEFVVANDPELHKIFDNLQIISNNVPPESFHYEIIGDCYDFAKDKKNMYIRQEATKELYQFNGSDITYDHDYKRLESEPRKIEGIDGIYDKSTILPLYYSRQDKINEVEDYYHLYKGEDSKNFSALAGGEIVWNKHTNTYSIWNHAKAVDIHDFTKGGRMRGNMQYKEDKWDVQINPLNFVQKNESTRDWTNTYGSGKKQLVPAECNLFSPPADVLNGNGNKDEEAGELTLPSDWERNVIQWEPTKLDKINKEVKLKDKYIKIRIRYTGDNLAVISALKTLYSISYA